ncbi:MAG: DNA-binding response regulator [Firmicutes bacterium]|nr:DNA-binding response regulator [Bacillota bacterium]
MRILILYSKEGRLGALAQGLARELKKGDCQVQLMEAEPQGSTPISGAPYDLVILGSPTLGFFGGKIAEDLSLTVPRFTRLEGKMAAAFVSHKLFGASKSLKAVMALLEKQGAMVEDFATLQSQSDIEAFGRRLLRLGRR